MRHIKLNQPYPNLERPLLKREQIAEKDSSDSGELVLLQTAQGQDIGVALMGAEQKSVACLISDRSDVTADQWLTQSVKKAIEKRKTYFSDQETTAFRLVNAEGDRLPGLTIDWYEGYLVVNIYTKSMQLYLDKIMELMKDFLPVKGAVLKRRYHSINEADSKWIMGEVAPEPLVVKENGLNYACYLNEGWMTGIFLDQHEVRRYLLETSRPSDRLLNLFSYTGAFSLGTAKKGGHTTSVDVANRSRKLTEEQFQVNGIDPESQSIYVFDAFKFLPYAKRKGMCFDRIVIDPPSFARTKKRVFRITKDYPELIEESLLVLNKGGELILSTNAANWTAKAYDQMIADSMKKAGRKYSYLKSFGLPNDFPTPKQSLLSHYLKVRVLKVD
ncbi:class I SAM-dependent rRNA methyltransferase [Atopobacter sp. AH10]|uniref:class I SAM-dependent rRNA methyltransferase n=1 Tax=Atopobacter sp. AH10 TaxID=2315861 RepID=UPI000EF1F259|nr:class I SAM-dependent rRNA methyltransferase [Atopobacter sp. AH10]RLK63537.1 class I SAM-dependent rRNA methyltransferase [Atopobacter sp. AH10]